jgi:hypothetical protein
MKNNSYHFPYITPEKCRTEKVCLLAVEKDKENLKYVPENLKNIVKEKLNLE